MLFSGLWLGDSLQLHLYLETDSSLISRNKLRANPNAYDELQLIDWRFALLGEWFCKLFDRQFALRKKRPKSLPIRWRLLAVHFLEIRKCSMRRSTVSSWLDVNFTSHDFLSPARCKSWTTLIGSLTDIPVLWSLGRAACHAVGWNGRDQSACSTGFWLKFKREASKEMSNVGERVIVSASYCLAAGFQQTFSQSHC